MKWLTENFIAHFRFMLILILTAILVYLFSLIYDIVFKIYYVVGVFLMGVIVLATLYVKDLSQYDEKVRLFDNIAQDLKLQYLIREVVFDNQSMADNSAVSSITRKIQNKMDEKYQKYLIIIKSDYWVPSIQDITLRINGIIENLSVSSAEPCMKKVSTIPWDKITNITGTPVTINIKKTGEKDIYISKFFIPLYLQTNESKEFEVSYRTKAYTDAILGRKDSVAVDINHVSERLSFQLSLEDKFREIYKIKQCDENDPLPHMGKLCFQITDSSKQRMILSEKELERNHIVPFYSDYKVQWTVLNPKMGYKYELFFTLEKKK